MRVGILTDYNQGEATYAALDLAALCVDWGLAPRLCPLTETHLAVSSAWDARVRDPKCFAAFVRGLDALVWTCCGDTGRLKWCRQKEFKSYYVPLWQELDPDWRDTYALYTAIVAPSRAVARVLRDQYGLSNVHDGLWSPTRAVFRKPLRTSPALKMLVMVEGQRAAAVPVSVCQHVGRALELAPNLEATFLVSCWNAAARRRLGALQKRFPGRVHSQRMPVYEEFPELVFRYDLMFLPSLCESIGVLALWALHCGVPVVAWDVPPLKEIVETGRNGVLVPCKAARHANGHAFVEAPEWAAAAEVLAGLAGDPERFAQLQAQTGRKLERRRQTFERIWAPLFNPSPELV